MKKNFLLMTMIASLLALVIVGCGGGASTATAPTQAPAAPATQAPAAKPATAATQAPTAGAASGAQATQPASPASGGGQATAGANAQPPVVSSPPSDPIGVLAIKPGDPIVLAFALSQSGSTAALGEDTKRGIEIALDDAGGALFNHKLQLIGEDDGCSPEGGQTAASKLAANAKIVGIVGALCSSASKVMAPVITQAGMTMVSPSSTSLELTDPAKHVEGFLRTAHNDKVQGQVAADFVAKQLKLKKAATIHDGSTYAAGLVDAFAQAFKQNGGEVVAQEAVNVGETDMRPVLTRVATKSPDIIYYPIFVAEGAFITRQAKEVKGLEKVTLMGSDGLFAGDFVKSAGDAATAMYLSSPDFSQFGSGYSAFQDKYQKKYGEKPNAPYHAHAYDATMMILNAVKKVAVAGQDGALYIPRKGLRDALYATKDFKGLTGNLTCDKNGDCADPHIAVYQLTATDPAGFPDKDTKKVYPTQ